MNILFTYYFFILLLILERGREGERKGEKHGCERETSVVCLHTPQLGTKRATSTRALTGNQTGDLLVCRITPSQLSHAGQGDILFFKVIA